jgi:integrase
MPIRTTDFTPVQPGLKWDRRNKTALFDARSPSGKRIRRVLPFDGVASAKAAFPTFRADVKAGRYDDAANHEEGVDTIDSVTTAPVVTQVAPSFREYVATQWKSINAKCSDSTERSNRSSLNAHLLPFFGDMAVTSIDEAACEDFGLYMKEKEKAPPTVNFALRLLRKVLHHARRRKVIAYDAMPENFQFLKETMLKLEMNDSEQDAFVTAFDDEVGFRSDLQARQKRSGKVVRSPRFGFKERRFGGGLKSDSEAAGIYFERFRRSRLIFFAALDLGLSETDLRLLKRPSVDLTNGRVEVVRGKTKKVATIALSDRCRAAIVEALSQAIISTEYVFTTENGKPYSESTLRRYFAIAKRLAGISRRCRLNDLRHTFASNLINDGIPSIVVRDALGHADVRMTQRYAKPSAHALEQMRASLNRRGKPDIKTASQVQDVEEG